MKCALSTLLLLAWALWFGGEMTLFLSVMALFKHDRAIAIQAAPQLFSVFERYQIVLALVAVASSAVIYLLTRSRVPLALLGLLWLASIGAFISIAMITPHIMELRETNRTQSDEFKTTHARGEYVYKIEFCILLAAGLLIPSVLRTPAQPRIVPESSQAPVPLV